MAYNTGNPIGSTDPRDLLDNSQILDELVNGPGASVPDRFGVSRRTISGMESYFDSRIASLGYDLSLGDYAAGKTITDRGQVVLRDGEYYKAAASVSLPLVLTGTWGTDSAKLVAVGDAALRQELTANANDFNLLPEIANYALLRAYTGDVTAYYVRGVSNIFDGGAGVFRVDAADTTTADNGGTVLVDASGRRWKREFSGNVSVRWFGATGSPDENLSTVLSKISTGSTASVINIPNPSFTVSPAVNFSRDVTLIGNGDAVMTGYCTRARLDGITRKTEKTLAVRSSPGVSPPPAKVSLYEQRAGNAFYAIQPLANGYIQTFFYAGYGTDVLSIGAPHELVRAVEVRYLYDCLVAHKTPSATTNVDLNWGSGVAINIEREIVRSGHTGARGNGTLDVHRVNVGGSISYTLNKLPADNYEGGFKANVAFYTSASSSNNVTISVNGTVVKTVSLVSGAQSLIRIEEFEIPFNAKAFGEVTPVITVTNAGSSHFYIIAANLYRLNKVPSNLVSIDYFKVFDSGRFFRSNFGASDYAILDKDTGIFCGSFHGGETSSSHTVKLDGLNLPVGITSGTAILFKSAKTTQMTNINNKLTSYVVHEINDCGYDIKVNMSGSIRAEKFFTAMATTHPDFVYVTYPGFIDLSSGDNGQEYYLPNTNHVVYQTAGTDVYRALQTSIEYTIFDDSYNEQAGSYILKSDGNYNKLYYAPIFENDVIIEQINFVAKHRFSDS